MNIKLHNIEKSLQYYELLMVRDLETIDEYPLSEEYSFVFWGDDKSKDDWINIHIETGEFNSIYEANEIFDDFYNRFYDELSTRCLFIENKNGEKIATATISHANEYGYNCVIDWFAISPKAQGLGLSKPLLSKTLQIARNMGYNKVLLHTQTHTWLAAKVYLDCGFHPFKTEGNKGWDILNTIIEHPKLNRFKRLSENEIYDKLILEIKNELDKLHKNYTYSVWYIENRKDVYVKEGNKYFYYKYHNEEGKISLIKQ